MLDNERIPDLAHHLIDAWLVTRQANSRIIVHTNVSKKRVLLMMDSASVAEREDNTAVHRDAGQGQLPTRQHTPSPRSGYQKLYEVSSRHTQTKFGGTSFRSGSEARVCLLYSLPLNVDREVNILVVLPSLAKIVELPQNIRSRDKRSRAMVFGTTYAILDTFSNDINNATRRAAY